MVNDIIEFPAGTSKEAMKEAEKEFKKDCLAQSMGKTREEFDDILNEAKEFFEGHKKEILRGEVIGK